MTGPVKTGHGSGRYKILRGGFRFRNFSITVSETESPAEVNVN